MHVERAEVELLRGLDAVDQGHHAVPADAADVEAVESEPGHVVLDVDSRLVLHEVREVLDHPFLDRLAVDDRHHARRIPDRSRPERGGDGDGIEEGRRLIGRRLGGGLGSGRVPGVRRRAGGRLREGGGARQKQDQSRRCDCGRSREGTAIEVGSVHCLYYIGSRRVRQRTRGAGARQGVPRMHRRGTPVELTPAMARRVPFGSEAAGVEEGKKKPGRAMVVSHRPTRCVVSPKDGMRDEAGSLRRGSIAPAKLPTRTAGSR